MREPISALSSFVYFFFGVGLYTFALTPETLVMAFFMFLLFAGSLAMHASKSDFGHDLDHAGMNATFAALATMAAGGPWLAMLVAGLAAAWVTEFILNVPNRHLMGVFLWIAVMGAYANDFLTMALTAVAIMGVGFAFWLTKEDSAHGLIWHPATALGIYLLTLANGA